MKNFLLLSVITLTPFLLSLSDKNTDVSLADEIVGEYTGMFAKDGHLTKGFKIKVTKLGDTKVLIKPFSKGSGHSIEADVWEDNLSAIRILRLSSEGPYKLDHAMISPDIGRLSYSIGFGKDHKHIEVFSGLRE